MKTGLWKEYRAEYENALKAGDNNAIIWRKVYLLGMLTDKQAKDLYQLLWEHGCNEIRTKNRPTWIEFPSGGVGLTKYWEK